MKLSLSSTVLGCLALLGCKPAHDEVGSAREALQAALSERDPARVAQTARMAGAFEGQEPALDRLLGDALANVLMRPSEGLKLLEKNPARGNPEWQTAISSAAMRTGESAVFTTILELTDATPFMPTPDLLAWTATQALADPKIDVHTLRARSEDCVLFDAHPPRGRRTVDQPAPADLGDVLFKLGAERVVLGRAGTPTDPAPSTGRGLQPCRTGRLFPGHVFPEPLPRHLTMSISAGGRGLHLSVRPEADDAWVFASTRAVEASKVVAESRRVSRGGDANPSFLPLVLAGEAPMDAPMDAPTPAE